MVSKSSSDSDSSKSESSILPITPSSSNLPSPSETGHEEYLRRVAKKRIISKLAFHIHLITFLFVNILLGLINFLTTTTGYPWVLWVTSGWLVGLLYHFFAHRYARSGGFAWHFFTYTVINSYLFFIYMFTSPGEYLWFLWPLGLWGIGLLTHGVIFYIITPKRDEDASKPWIERQIDRELSKIFDEPRYNKQVCPQCGTLIHHQEKFCPQCGNHLNE